ncbi:MAG: ABC transporter permease [Saprospiraceae bacterium]|nr:ABC transporter permease [Saprospiraceae bacterium]MCB9318376.1 ABC transporter permease [Lewinellaceae bacterium]
MHFFQLKILFRNLFRQRVFTLINLSGLALGIMCSLLIFLWVADELGYDRFHEKLDRLYVVTSKEVMEGEMFGSYDTPGLLGEELPRKFPEIEMACNMSWTQYMTVSVGERNMLRRGNYAGPDYFSMFTYPALAGSVENALKSPDNMVITENMAVVFFGSANEAIGQVIKVDNKWDMNVAAVVQDVPSNSSEQFDFLLSWELFKKFNPWMDNWHNSGPYTFVLLKENTDAGNLIGKLKAFIKQYDKDYADNDHLELGLQPYGERYLHSNFKNGYVAGGRIEYVRLFILVALFILMIACVNFMNLSTAYSLKRSKEIGVKKVMGAERMVLIRQFISEAILFSFFATILALMVVQLILPFFNQVVSKQLTLPLGHPIFWLAIGALSVLTGLLAGSYPAFMLSAFSPVSILKNELKPGLSGVLVRKGLVIFQFVLCVVFMISSLVITDQVHYIYTKNVGYEKNNLLYIRLRGDLQNQFQTFKDEALKIPGIEHVSRISQRPFSIENTTGDVDWEGKTPNTKPRFSEVAVDDDFLETMKSEMVMGRGFSAAFRDTAGFIINETALKQIGYEEPIGKPLTFWDTRGTIVGVIKDFNFSSLHQPIEPLVMRKARKRQGGYAMIRVEPQAMDQVIRDLETLVKKINPAFPFAHQFADEEYMSMYQNELLTRKLSGYFTFLGIFIACMGLFGLVLFMIEQRTREIGIRKVLGAPVSRLVGMISLDFVRLVWIALLIAMPLAYVLMERWLQDFAYRIGIPWWAFVLTGILTSFIAFATIGFHSLKAATANPIKSLRNE